MGNLALGPFLAAAALLVLAGVPKLADPSSLVLALRSVRLPARPVLGRLLAAGEIAVGALALVAPGRLSGVLVAASYLAFTAFVALALARGGVLASCGCFGRPDTPPTRTHLAVTVVLAASGVALAWAPPDPWSAAVREPVTFATLVGFAALVAALAYLALAVLPTVTPAAVRSASAPRRG
ncbi:MAG TPA: MauE/DoxX family redox-associated membrane protein [Angustibacter sp.]|nr:MauE/DoxX family redox-associated membrane protein [Angustibacter sp.]